MTLNQGQKKLLAMLGYPLLAVAVFLMTLSYTFPYKRVKSLILNTVTKTHDMTIGDIGPTWFPGGVKLESVLIKSRPKSSDDKPSFVALEKIKARVGFFGAIFGRPKISFHATNADGKVTGYVVQSKSYLDVELNSKNFPLNQLPGVRDAIGIPVTGALNADVKLELPDKKWKKAEGSIRFSCEGCTVGDGVSKMKMRAPDGKKLSSRAKSTLAFASEGITVPKLSLGETEGEIVIEKGVGKIKTFSSQSDDGFFRLGGKVKFEDPVARSTVPGCVTFKFSDSLKERLKKKEGPVKNFSAIEFMIAPIAKKDDGSFAFPLKGTLGRLKINKKKKCNKAGDGEDKSSPPRTTKSVSSTPRKSKTSSSLATQKKDDSEKRSNSDDQNEDGGATGGARVNGSGPIKGISAPGIPPAMKDRIDGIASPAMPRAVLKREENNEEDEESDDDEEESEEENSEEDNQDSSEDEEPRDIDPVE